MNWDDLRFVVAVARHGSLLKAAKELAVDHTTVGRRVAAAEEALGTRLFQRSTTGLRLTKTGEQLLAPLQGVEDAIHAVERRASADSDALVGTVKVTAPETFGITWLAPRLALLAKKHPGLHIELDPSGAVFDLNRREAEVAVRTFRAKDQSLVVRRAADIGYGLYASKDFLVRNPVRGAADLKNRPLLTSTPTDKESRWLQRLSGGAAPVFSCVVAVALAAAAKAGVGVAALPRYVGDAEPELVHLPMPDEPHDTLWLTVHRDLRKTPKVRLVLDFLVDQCRRHEVALRGR